MHHRGKLAALPNDIQAAFGRALRALFGHKADGMRPGLERYADHFPGRGHLEIERPVDFCFEPRDVVIANMAAILAQVRGNSIATGRDCDLRRAHGIWMTATARVADGGNVVDVDAKAEAVHAFALRMILSGTRLPSPVGNEN